MHISVRHEGLPAVTDRRFPIGAEDLTYNNFIIREFPPLLPGSTSHCFVLDGRDPNHYLYGFHCMRATVDECMEYIDEYNSTHNVRFDLVNVRKPLDLTGIYPTRRTKNAAGL
jgi:hypothetical protein